MFTIDVYNGSLKSFDIAWKDVHRKIKISIHFSFENQWFPIGDKNKWTEGSKFEWNLFGWLSKKKKTSNLEQNDGFTI